MTDKQHPADIDEHRDERRQPLTIVAGPPDPFAVADVAGGPVAFFDTALAFAYGGGIGSITLTTQQQLIGPNGVPCELRRIAVILKASLPALAHLKSTILEIERKANEEAAAAIASLERPAGSVAH